MPNHSITSFDMSAAYHAIFPSDANLTEVGPGTNAIDMFGANTFTLGSGNSYYLALGSAAGLESSIETLWDTLPGTSPQTISFTTTPPSPATLGGTYDVGVSRRRVGNPVTLTIDPSSTSGCTLSGASHVTFSMPSGSCVVDANEPGDTTFAPAAAHQTFQVTKVAQTVTFTSTPPASPTVGGSYAATATGGGSGIPVTLTIDGASTSGCTINGSGTVTFSAPLGTCVIDANQQGNATYSPAAQVQQTIGVGGVGQTVTFTSTQPSQARVGGAPYVPTATASSGLGVTIALDPQSAGCSLSGGSVSFTSVGTCVLDATQAGNSTYLSASQQQSFAISKGASMVTVTSKPPKSPQAGAIYVPAARASTGDAVVVTLDAHSRGCGITPTAVQLRTVGTCILSFTDRGNANYAASTVSQQLVIAKGHVQLRASATPAAARAGAVVSLSATASVVYATGVVTFSAGGKVLCAVALHGGVATCRTSVALSKGAYRVTASYSGSPSFFSTIAATRLRLS